MATMKRIGNRILNVTEDHIHRSPNLPKLYDYAPVAVLMDAIKPLDAPLFVDMGANVGDTIAIARMWDPDLECICVEPDPTFFVMLEKNWFNDPKVHLHKAIYTPKDLADRMHFEATGQTGSTRVVAKGDKSANTSNIKPVELKDVVTDRSRNLVIKSDTDGFDLHILHSCLDQQKDLDLNIQALFFEGPLASQMTSREYKDWFGLFDRLVAGGYRILMLSNLGYPVVNIGSDTSVLKSVMDAFHIAVSHKLAGYHYFDFIVYKPELETDYLTLQADWPESFTNTLKPLET